MLKQRNAVLSGKPHIDRAEIRQFLSQLKYPLQYLDFETFRTAIPMFDGVWPYQQIPFQFSLHVVEAKGGTPKHFSFLAEGKEDPRPQFLGNLVPNIRDVGSIICYNAPFEVGRLRESCEAYKEYQPWVQKIQSRVVDLLTPFRSFHYYHPDQKGSASLKAVLPALTSLTHDDLPIADGDTASIEFLRVTYGDASETERRQVRQQLERYCGLDTYGMVRIVDRLWEQG